MIKPLEVLSRALGSRVIIGLKGMREYRGVLGGYDPHMNIVLKDVEEIINGELKRKLDNAILRGDNVVYVSP